MKIITLILLCTISLSAVAQEKTNKNSKWEKMKDYMPLMTRGAGVSFQQFKGLNNRIAGFPQYAALHNQMWTLSLGSMHVIKNFISQLSVTGGSSLTGHPDEKSSTMRFLSGGFDMGYDVIPADRVMLYPLVGIGAENYHAIFYKDVNAVTFNDVANSPTVQNNIRSVKFINTFFTYRLGLGMAFKEPKGNHTIGLQAGYTAGFKDKSWKSRENQTLAGAPTDGLKRFAVSLVITGDMMMGKK